MIDDLRGSSSGSGPAAPERLKARQFSKAATIAIAFAAYVALALSWRALRLPANPPQAGYQYSQALSFSFRWELALSFFLGGAIGWLTRRTALVALGMILPFAVAMCIEIAKDSTSHNLLPFEILISWMPVFLVSWGGAYVGLRFRERRKKIRAAGSG
jgi:hypothetical protein